jgi:sugar phosphate isomerase/epimerase
MYIYPLAWVLRWAREAGFEGVELDVNPEAIVRGGRSLRQLAQSKGVEILTVHPTVVPLPGWRERHDGMDRTIRLAQEIGAGLVVMHTPRSVSLNEGEGLAFRQTIEEWQPRLAGSGLQLAVENKAIRTPDDRTFVLTPVDGLQGFCERHDLGLVLDTTHAGTAGEDLLSVRKVFGKRLANVHLSDMGGRVPLAGLPWVDTMLGQHRFPGSGSLALEELLADLGSNGYTGPVTLELNPFAVRVWWPPAVRRRMHEAAQWLKSALGSGGGSEPSTPAAGS